VATDANTIPDDPDTWLRRAALAEALTCRGLTISTATLASMAVRGGGPPFKIWGAYPLYRWGDAWTWAQMRLEAPRRRRRAGAARTSIEAHA
jgi:hypothetical protein